MNEKQKQFDTAINGSQLVKLTKYISYMSLLLNS